jgi:hypothetical protein
LAYVHLRGVFIGAVGAGTAVLLSTFGVAAAQPGATTTTTNTTTSVAATTSSTVSGNTTTTSTNAPSLSAAQLLASCISSANAEHALEWTATLHGDGLNIKESAQAGRFDGTQVITGYRGGDRLTMHLVLIGKKAYVTANANALMDLLGLKDPAATQEAGKWIAIKNSAGKIYQNLAAGLTVASATQSLDLVGKLSEVPETTRADQLVVGVEGTSMALGVPGTQTIYMKANGVPLPVEAVQDYDGVVQDMTFAGWGQAPVAKAPPTPVAFLKSWLG